eukprot:s4283_g5.t1
MGCAHSGPFAQAENAEALGVSSLEVWKWPESDIQGHPTVRCNVMVPLMNTVVHRRDPSPEFLISEFLSRLRVGTSLEISSRQAERISEANLGYCLGTVMARCPRCEPEVCGSSLESCKAVPPSNMASCKAMTLGALSLMLMHGVQATCTPSANNLCMKVNLFTGETGSYEFAGYTGPSPDIEVRIGQTYTFDQTDPSNWYHAIGFAYFPDGAHGATWGADERAEVEAKGELLYKIDGAATTCPDAGDTGLDCYEPEFFYPRGDWMAKKYTAELTITQAMADQSHGGVIYYFCHIHSKMSGRIIIKNADGSAMSGRIIIKNADGSAVTQANGQPLPNPQELSLYSPVLLSGVDHACGTHGIESFAGGGSRQCSERFLCGKLTTTFEKCMQAIDCKMKEEMLSHTSSDHADKVAIFMQQMIPHHDNAVNMAKILFKQVDAATIDAAIEEGGLTDMLNDIINVQNFQIHQFRNYLGGAGLLTTTTVAVSDMSTRLEDLSGTMRAQIFFALVPLARLMF